MHKFDTVDGNHAAAHISYFFTDVATIYPITPSSSMAELVDEWSAHGRKNLFGQNVRVVEMQSEAGAAGAMHGSLQAGALTTTYTASQGLLLMIPNIYKMVGELLPGVFHVSARAIATHALSIFGDHQDVMACRQTGAMMLTASNVQEVLDLAAVAHLSAIKARLPIIHFFDGFRTSHEYQKVNTIEPEELEKLIDWNAIESFRSRSLSPEHPVVRGTAQNPDIYFQGREVQNKYFDAAPQIVQSYMDSIKNITGREYHLFDYYGAPDAESIIIGMGSVCDTCEETVDYLNSSGKKTGLVKVRLYRPFSIEHFLRVIPNTVKRIAVLDRTKEPGSLGEPLYLDVVKAFAASPMRPLIVGGRFGLGSKDTRPSHIISVFDNLEKQNPKDRFTIGIDDDVTGTSLPESDKRVVVPEGTYSCKFWGLGSDGTVGANKAAIQIIGNNTDMYVQGYFSYDSKKSGGSTVSHLRFGNNPIRSPYLVYEADYIACHNKSFVYNINVLEGIKDGGVFVLNCDWSEAELEEELPAILKRTVAEKNVRFYTIDAISIAQSIGLGNRINMVMQSAFFKLIGVLPKEEATRLLKESIESMYGRKGKEVVEKNFKAVDMGMSSLREIKVPSSWLDAAKTKESETEMGDTSNELNSFVNRIQRKIARHEGDEIPVSAFEGMEDGTYPSGTTAYEKRGIAVMIPQWVKENCIECGQCSFVCPHATIRLFFLDEEEKNSAPEGFETLDAKGKGFESYSLRVQVSPFDCTGCGNCADICPPKDKALVMKPAEVEMDREAENWEFAMTVTPKEHLMPKNTIKGSQLFRPLLEFNGACPGCGETPYIRLLTQLFGERMMIANATGCSSIWGASAPSIAYTTNHEGKGPAWANSLFEDNAEYGYGMYLGVTQMRDKIEELMRSALEADISEDTREAFEEWIANREDPDGSKKASEKIRTLLKIHEMENTSSASRSSLASSGQAIPETSGGRQSAMSKSELFSGIMRLKDYLVKRSIWLIGGDGWAYDIGYGGLDHVLAMGDDVNIFVMDTEIYSNTGGQSSKSTPASAVAKFAAKGKRTRKKDLGRMAMSYGNVYVAQIAMGANMNQTIRAITEAESYPGPSLIIAYSPCISHGIRTGMGTSIKQEKKAVESGYWHLYRYNPLLSNEGKNPFILDSKEPAQPYSDFLNSEIRFTSLANTFPEEAKKLFARSQKHAEERLAALKQLTE
jgi:pyruvate-ferredoxin/flavodoxin oxidoreductase